MKCSKEAWASGLSASNWFDISYSLYPHSEFKYLTGTENSSDSLANTDKRMENLTVWPEFASIKPMDK